ncbi:MAG: iron-sulfur cluster assembly accessory protein [Chitinophagaceae bacterium]|nr:MAG: iron-sulfur cluster assembly accessory protein [Chitinophagaceae bacterium]
METTITSPLTFTPKAIEEIDRLMMAPDFDTTKLLRVGVKGGGCSGMSYILGFDHRQDNDDIHEIDGLQFLLNRSHSIYLMGMEIDWQDGLNARGFSFSNPNASKTCGCGTSFSV